MTFKEAMEQAMRLGVARVPLSVKTLRQLSMACRGTTDVELVQAQIDDLLFASLNAAAARPRDKGVEFAP